MMIGETETIRARYTFTSDVFMEKKREFFPAHFFTGDNHAVVTARTDKKKMQLFQLCRNHWNIVLTLFWTAATFASAPVEA